MEDMYRYAQALKSVGPNLIEKLHVKWLLKKQIRTNIDIDCCKQITNKINCIAWKDYINVYKINLLQWANYKTDQQKCVSWFISILHNGCRLAQCIFYIDLFFFMISLFDVCKYSSYMNESRWINSVSWSLVSCW